MVHGAVASDNKEKRGCFDDLKTLATKCNSDYTSFKVVLHSKQCSMSLV